MTVSKRFALMLLIYLACGIALSAQCRESASEQSADLEKIKQLTAQIKLEPKHSFLYATRGQCYVGLKDWNEALANTNTALGISSTNCSYYRSRAAIYYAMGRKDLRKADLRKADLQKSEQIDPTDPENLKGLAICFYS